MNIIFIITYVIHIIIWTFILLAFLSKKLSIERVASDLDKPADEATEAIKSFLFTLDSFNYIL